MQQDEKSEELKRAKAKAEIESLELLKNPPFFLSKEDRERDPWDVPGFSSSEKMKELLKIK